MNEPKWINVSLIKMIHDQQIKEHGGLYGIRDEKLLLSALDAPKNNFYYSNDVSLNFLASKYVYTLANNHPFIDGNKRSAYICMRLFLKLNSSDIIASAEEKILLMINIASSKYSIKDINNWLDSHTTIV